TLLRELEDGEFEEITYEIPLSENVEETGETEPEADLEDPGMDQLAYQAPGYVDLVARSQREYDALKKLSDDFKISQKEQQEAENKAAAEEELAMEQLEEEQPQWPEDAAETAFGGPGLPLSPATPAAKRNGNMHGVGLPADQRHMTEIEG
ncbi:hypothetical protein FG05_30724, partial [Fusarium graminearum]